MILDGTMAKSGYLDRQRAVYRKLLDAGMDCGEQYMIDCVMIALHRQGWGYTRIKRLVDDVEKLRKYFAPSLVRGMEQDIYQERMDEEIRSFVGTEQPFVPFAQRYPAIEQTGYDKLPKRN